MSKQKNRQPAKNSPEAMARRMIENLPEKTGKSLPQWLSIVKQSGLQKHGEIVKHLKTEHNVSHGFANLISQQYRSAGDATDPNALVEKQYSGAKAHLLPLHEELCRIIRGFGEDVQISPKKAYVSIRRNKQFALIQPSTKNRMDVGINLKGEAPQGRLEASGSFNAMVSHRVRITQREDINDELTGWLEKAYRAA